MQKFEYGRAARFAAAAGLGLTLAFGAAPVVALAEGDVPTTEVPATDGVSESTDQDQSVVNIATAQDLANAIVNQEDGQTWNLTGKEYDLDAECLKKYDYMGTNTLGQTGWYFPIFKDNITIKGNGATITSSVERDNGAWATQNFITVVGDRVKIDEVNIVCKKEVNKAIEVLGADFELSNSEICTVDGDNSGSIYFNTGAKLPGDVVTSTGNAKLTNVTVHSWIRNSALGEGDTLTLDGVTIDFTKNSYAANNKYVTLSDKNTTVGDGGLTVLVDNGVASLESQVIAGLPNGSTVLLTEDIKLHDTLNIKGKRDIVIDGQGHAITAADDFKKDANGQLNLVKPEICSNITFKNVDMVATPAVKSVLDVWGSDAVSLDNVTLDHSASDQGGCALVVNGSNVTADGPVTLVTGTLSWGAANLDISPEAEAGGRTTASFIVSDEGGNLSLRGDKSNIYTEKTNDSVVVDLGDNMTQTSSEQGVSYSLAMATIGKHSYPSLEAALAVATDDDIITLAPGEHRLAPDQCFVLNNRVTIQGAADGSTVITGSGVANNGNGLFTFSSGSEGSVLKDLTINYTASGAQRAAVYFDYGFAGGPDDNVTKIENVRFKGDDIIENENAIAISSTYTTGGYVEISGCTIENYAYGMYFNGIHDLTITGNTINGTKYNAINIAGDGDVECENIVIKDNTLTNISTGNYGSEVYSSGINVGSNSSSVTIEDNSISMLYGKKPVNIVQDDDTNDTVVVTYKVDGVDYATVIAGVEDDKASFAAPADPSKSGYTFRGWDYAGANVSVKDGVVTIALPESGAPDKGYTFSAQFSKNSVPSTPSGDAVKVEQSEGGKVSVTPTRADEGDEVTITATPDEGQEVREVTVTDEDGKSVQVKAGEKDGEWTFEMPDGAVTVTVTFGCDGGELCPTHGFNDVDQSAWYHDAVDWAVTEGVLNGYGEGGESLGPVADVTRAEMAQMLWNRAGRPEATADLSAFTDVDAGGWYAPALEWCVSEGIFSGYGDTFGTERTISREEAATVLWRIAGSPEADADLSGYGDASKVSDYATGAVEWAVSTGVLTGKGNVALDPQAGCTRGEVAAMMMRMAQ